MKNLQTIAATAAKIVLPNTQLSVLKGGNDTRNNIVVDDIIICKTK
jgi:hypothetical protein